MIQAARRLYVTPGQHLSLGQVVELNKRFLQAYVKFKGEPRVQQLRTDVLKYNRLLRDLGLRDHQVSRALFRLVFLKQCQVSFYLQVPAARRASWKTLGLFTYRVGLLAVWSIFALPGVILNGPIFLTAKIMSRKKARGKLLSMYARTLSEHLHAEALAASTVKVAARDVIGSWKVLISVGLAPILYGFYAFLATLVMIKANAPLTWTLWTPFIVMAALPIIGFAALKFGEAGMDVLK